jgi:hypothetical protein
MKSMMTIYIFEARILLKPVKKVSKIYNHLNYA